MCFSNIVVKTRGNFQTYQLDGVTLKRVTTWIKDFTPKFERDEVAKSVAERSNLGLDKILADWDAKAHVAIEVGNLTHDYIEKRLQGVIPNPLQYHVNGRLLQEVKAFESFFDYICSKGIAPIYVEWVIGSKSWKLGGRVDALLVDTSGKYHLFDWKTSEKPLDQYWGKSFNPPFDGIPHTKLNEYFFQLSTYKAIIEHESDIKIDSLNIVHLKNNGQYRVFSDVDFSHCITKCLKENTGVQLELGLMENKKSHKKEKEMDNQWKIIEPISSKGSYAKWYNEVCLITTVYKSSKRGKLGAVSIVLTPATHKALGSPQGIVLLSDGNGSVGLLPVNEGDELFPRGYSCSSRTENQCKQINASIILRQLKLDSNLICRKVRWENGMLVANLEDFSIRT